MNRFYSSRPAVVLLAATALLIGTFRASAEHRPFKERGTAQFVSPTDYIGSGQSTHLGHYTEVGSARFAPTPVPGILDVHAFSIYTAANGDELYATINGQLNGVTGEIAGTITYVGGTGRFEDVDGSASLSGQMQPDGSITVSAEGTIDY